MTKQDQERQERALAQIEKAVKTLDSIGDNRRRFASELDRIEESTQSMQRRLLERAS